MSSKRKAAPFGLRTYRPHRRAKCRWNADTGTGSIAVMGEVEPDGLSESRKREFRRIEDAGKLLISQGLDSSESLRPMLYEIVELLDDIAAGERSSQGTAPNTKFVPYTTMLFVCGVQSRYIMCSVMGSVVAYVFGRCAQSVCHYARLTGTRARRAWCMML